MSTAAGFSSYAKQQQAFNPVAALAPTTLATPQQGVYLNPNPQDSFSKSPVTLSETPQQQTLMLQALQSALPQKAQGQLQQLLQSGRLLSVHPQDGPHSALYYLYQSLNSPKAPSLNAKKTVQETLDILNNPYRINQTFVPLGFLRLWALLKGEKQAGQSIYNEQAAPHQRSVWEMAKTQINYNCVPAAILTRLALHQPSVLARMAYEASSPKQMVEQTITAAQWHPQNPSQAEALLQGHNFTYRAIEANTKGEAQFRVGLPVPQAGLVRAQQAQMLPWKGKANSVEVLLQTALAYNFTGKTYDPSVDKRDNIETFMRRLEQSSLEKTQKQRIRDLCNGVVKVNDLRQVVAQELANTNIAEETKTTLLNDLYSEEKGLSQQEKTAMERLVLRQGEPVVINYQVCNSLNDPNKRYIFGYNAPLNAIQNDLLTALQHYGSVTASIGFTTSDGRRTGSHQVVLTGARKSPQTGELEFKVADSDDRIEEAIYKPAKTLIPNLADVNMPDPLAVQIKQRMAQGAQSIYQPSQEEVQAFKTIQTTELPYPENKPTPIDEMRRELNLQQTTDNVTGS